jgi:hypothetical protein
MGAGEAADLWVRQRREIVLQDGRSKRFQPDPLPGQDRMVSKHLECDHEVIQSPIPSDERFHEPVIGVRAVVEGGHFLVAQSGV